MKTYTELEKYFKAVGGLSGAEIQELFNEAVRSLNTAEKDEILLPLHKYLDSKGQLKWEEEEYATFGDYGWASRRASMALAKLIKVNLIGIMFVDDTNTYIYDVRSPDKPGFVDNFGHMFCTVQTEDFCAEKL